MKKSFLALSVGISSFVYANQSTLISESSSLAQACTTKASSKEWVESAFSPNAGSEELVLKVINSSERSIRLAAYTFTSPPVVKALLAAKMRGVDIRVIVDEKGNKGKPNIAALSLLVNAGIQTRTISVYAIHHDKYIVSDERHVQSGSFNYSHAATKSNSENVIVIWNNPAVAASYLQHWESRFNQGTDFKSSY